MQDCIPFKLFYIQYSLNPHTFSYKRQDRSYFKIKLAPENKYFVE